MARRRLTRQQAGSRRTAAGLGCVLCALLLGLSFLPGATGIPLMLAAWQRRLLGLAAPVLPIYILLAGLVLIAAGERARFSRRIAGLVLGSLTALLTAHAWLVPQNLWGAGLDGAGTGLLAGALTGAVALALGRVGLWTVLGVLAVTSAALVTGLTAASLGTGLRAAIRGVLRLAVWLAHGVARIGRRAVRTVQGAWMVGRPAVAFLGANLTRAPGMAIALAMRIAARTRARSALETPGPAPGVAVGGPAPVPVVEDLARGGIDNTAGRDRKASRRPPAGLQEDQAQERLAFASADYRLPPQTVLGDGGGTRSRTRVDPADTARALEQTLESFGVSVKVVGWEVGPVVTRFEVQPEPGVKVQRITSLTNDIALNLAAQSVRIEAPIPGKSAVGIELPNQKASLVHLREILASDQFQKATGPLVVAIGKDIAGHPVVADLTEMPHLLIAGATGSGKSVALNAMIASLLFRCTPRQVRLVMIDPKRVELTDYNEIPHLLTPVVTNPRQAASVLKDMLRVMEQRFELFAQAGARNIQSYNQLADVEPLYYIVIIIDELADLMMVAPADFEDIICRLAQMTRATGIHLVVATQRPSVDVITGLIKANIPSRLAFAVSSQVDSRTILDGPGAEKLLGRGDMLFLPLGASRAIRAQGAYIADDEIRAVVEWWRQQGRPEYDPQLVEAQRSAPTSEHADGERLIEAARLVVRSGYGSVSLLQRKMRIGYVTAARLIDELEARGVVGPVQGSNPREVLIGLDDLERLLRSGAVPKKS
jgi:S-DNA-T family DNA segregation ATPase FtsK/SpoIIIE